jgi:quinol monooxygenase YgiN
VRVACVAEEHAVYVVIVEFTIHAEHADAFMAALLTNALASREGEHGCRQFDVCTAPGDRTRVFLYEVYDDKAAFDAHVRTAHFATFDRETAPWIAHRSVRLLERVDPA